LRWLRKEALRNRIRKLNHRVIRKIMMKIVVISQQQKWNKPKRLSLAKKVRRSMNEILIE
jgi:hypothetical protein